MGKCPAPIEPKTVVYRPIILTIMRAEFGTQGSAVMHETYYTTVDVPTVEFERAHGGLKWGPCVGPPEEWEE